MTASRYATLAAAPYSGVALIAACSAGFLWGTGALVVNILIARYGFAPGDISFWRFAVGAIFLCLIFGTRIHLPTLRTLLVPVVLAGATMAGYVLCWFLGIERIGAAIPTLIALCLPPVFSTLIALARGQERLDLSLAVILTAALGGTVLIVARHGGMGEAGQADLIIGLLCSVASALLYTGFTLVSGRLSSALGAGQAATCLTVVAALVMGLTTLARPLQWPSGIPPQAWFLYLGVVTAALALLVFSWGAARLTPTALTVATLIEPLTAVVLSALLLGERLGASQWAGGVLLLLSIWGLGRRLSRPTPSEQT
ncbi:putative transmembrane protein [Herbaspirillum frisingense GSF30]|uniref:Transmembrane protein n=1 Tax=Herbaspirillum frisingense GSF30 TaxID=864073 RepID=A0AAI9N2Q0_9BURK|nr:MULTISPECIES: DMT family transporter [Herbaspirillum]EOA03517.1 putative transmembrane protein [Herbaspirillum frisingense GSF30]MCI1013838.1 DMT family transporter [Herbaspirillum sp. C7C2]ONN64927.1 EamA family transporter [Herbaspirillum sp. VT-16-41]